MGRCWPNTVPNIGPVKTADYEPEMACSLALKRPSVVNRNGPVTQPMQDQCRQFSTGLVLVLQNSADAGDLALWIMGHLRRSITSLGWHIHWHHSGPMWHRTTPITLPIQGWYRTITVRKLADYCSILHTETCFTKPHKTN